MTLQQIKDSLPKWVWLQTEQDVWREGDESYGYEYVMSDVDQGAPDWYKVTPRWFGKTVSSYIARRPIPPEVIENQAWWILYNQLATGDINGVGYVPSIDIDNESGEPSLYVQELRHCFSGIAQFWTEGELKKVFPLLGGEQNIIKHLSAGNLYDKWLGEQLK